MARNTGCSPLLGPRRWWRPPLRKAGGGSVQTGLCCEPVSASVDSASQTAFAARAPGYRTGMRIGNTEIRPLGGGAGCLTMILVSVLLSVLLTVLLNLVL